MGLKQKRYTAQEYIQIGMAFFLIGVLVNMVADGRMLGVILSRLITNNSWANTIQEISAGFSIPIFCISIYFNVRGLCMYRQQQRTKPDW